MNLQVDDGRSVYLFFGGYDNLRFHTGQECGDIRCLYHGWHFGVKSNDYFRHMQNFSKYFIDLCHVELWFDLL